MSPYADSNFFTRLYLRVIDDEAAQMASEVVGKRVKPFPCTFLHRIEVLNAFQVHVFIGKLPGQNHITPEQAALAHADFQADLAEGEFLRGVEPARDELESVAEELILRHTAKHGFRTYDILHVASALLLGCETFWSFDAKAKKLAALEGLKVR